MQDWSRIAADIGAAAGLEVSADSVRPVTGGCINSAWRLACADGHLFVKTNTSSALEMFEAEHDGLEELLAADALRVPRPLATGVTGGCAWIAMEWIETGRSRHGTARDLGLGLARQHRCLAEKFGWARDNTIGSTPQANGWFSEWVEFYSQRRIRYQLDLAARNSYPGRLLEAGGLAGAWSALVSYSAALLACAWVYVRDSRAVAENTLYLLLMALAAGWCNVSFIMAVLDGTVVRVLLLFYLSPFWAVLLGWLMLGERLDTRSMFVFIVAVCGDIMTMPGLPRVPSADNIYLNEKGQIEGLF